MPRLVITRFDLVLTVSLLSIACLCQAGPREDVDQVAGLIDKHYFDPKLAADIAGKLRKEASDGVYDRFIDRNDLVIALTQKLKPIDAHFSVGIRQQRDARAREQSGPRAEFSQIDLRNNYGFRRVERLPGNIGYIELTSVAHIEFDKPLSPSRRAADAAIDLVRGTNAIVLDLRNNGGGAPSMVGYLVSAFVGKDADVYNVFHSREGTESEKPVVFHPDPILDTPLYVLTGARTGSAAEAIAYTLQTCGRARVVGERSAGAANPGGQFPTPGGLVVFISTGSPRNPINGRNWERDGVVPNDEIASALALRRAQEIALTQIATSTPPRYEQVDAMWVLETLQQKPKPLDAKRLTEYTGDFGNVKIEVADGTLKTRVGRREPLVLIALKEDVFYPETDPARRFTFVRDKGRVVALLFQTAEGDTQRMNKAAAP